MFVILIDYIQPLEQILDRINAALEEHKIFLEQHYASGHFLLSGRREPRTGGLILARGKDQAELEAIIKLDPFHQQKLARYTILEFHLTMTANALAGFREIQAI